jgi:hypothetical protein
MGQGVSSVGEKRRKCVKTGEKVEKVIHKAPSESHRVGRRGEGRDQSFLFPRRVDKRGWWGGSQ